MRKTVGICCVGDWSLFGKKLIDCKKNNSRIERNASKGNKLIGGNKKCQISFVLRTHQTEKTLAGLLSML